MTYLGLIDDNIGIDINLVKIRKSWLSDDVKDDEELIHYNLFDIKH